MEKLTKYSFAFTKDDIRALESIKKLMKETQGKVANIGAIRLALRIAVRVLDDKMAKHWEELGCRVMRSKGKPE